MTKAARIEIISVTLELNAEEAEYLRDLTRNYLGAQHGPGEEIREEAMIRRGIHDALASALDNSYEDFSDFA